METFLKKNLLDGLTPTFTRASTATKITSQGIEEAAIDEIRIDPVRGFLLEEESTNIFTYSEGDSSTYAIIMGVQDAITSIGNFDNSIEFYQSGATNTAYKPYATLAGETYAISVFVEMDDGLEPIVGIYTGTGDFSLVIDQGIVTLAVNVEHISGSLYRVSAATLTDGTGTNVGIIKYAGQSLRTFRISGVQLENLPYATSYIKTEASTATRAADNLIYQLGAGKFPQEFQVAMTFTPLADGADYSILSLFGTDDNNGYEIRTLGATTPDLTYDTGGLIFTVDTDLLIQDTANEYVFTAVQNDTNVRGIIQSNYATEYNDVKAGTLNHSDLGEFQIGKYNITWASGYYKNLRLYSKD